MGKQTNRCSFNLSLIISFCTLIASCYVQIVSSAQWDIVATLPRGDFAMAIGYANDTLFMRGGWRNPKQFVQYNTATDTIIDNGNNYLSNAIYALGQSFTQYDNILYMLTPDETIATFDLSDSTFDYNFASTGQ